MTTDAKLKSACNHLKIALQHLAKAKSRKKAKRKNPCSANPRKRKTKKKLNPRVHFPKTRRGRPPVKRTWVITRKGATPLRFKASKADAFARAKKIASKGARLVLDGPK